MAKNELNTSHPCLQPPHTRVDIAPPEVARRPTVLRRALARLLPRAARA